MILRARTVLPVSGQLIENGAVEIVGDRITRVGKFSSGRDVTDLGDVILMPGLVNAHAHLDYTDMAGLLLPPKSFADWIKALLAIKSSWSYSEYAQSWLNGARMLLETGTTLVGDIESVPELLPQVWNETPLRVISFLEMTGVKSRRAPSAILDDAIRLLKELDPARQRTGFSPHALYSTSPDLIRLTAEQSRRSGAVFTSHVSESQEEFEMYTKATGPLHAWLKAQRDMVDCDGSSPVETMNRLGALCPQFLAAHVNYLADGDGEVLGRSGSHVVHCPSSHRFFGHDPFPIEELRRHRVNVCLGTDSLASSRKSGKRLPSLNMFHEMQLAMKSCAGVTPQDVLRMATVNGARAMGREGQCGELAKGAWADCVVIPYEGSEKQAVEAAVQHKGAVAGVMIGGKWARFPEAVMRDE